MNLALLRAVSLAVVTGFAAVAAEADSDRHGHGRDRHDDRRDYRGHDRYHDNFRSSYHRDRGYWHHGHHNGRDGWWWVAAGIWSLYPQPVYPYPRYESRVVIVDRPQPAPVVMRNSTPFWYYCDSSGNYYPYVSYCPEGWRAIATEPRDLN